MLAQLEGLLARLQQQVGEPLCSRGRLHLVHQHGELTRTPARQQVLSPREHLRTTLSGLQQQLIARGVSERVADEPQALDVDQGHRDALLATPADLA